MSHEGKRKEDNSPAEIEITDEMIEAGVLRLEGYFGPMLISDLSAFDESERIVASIFSAMAAARPGVAARSGS